MKIKINKSVNITITGAIWWAWVQAVIQANEMGATEIRLTSGKRYRKKGDKFSFHFTTPRSQAIDFVVEGVNRRAFLRGLKVRLGPNYDIIYHKNRGSAGKHIHLELDPKI